MGDPGFDPEMMVLQNMKIRQAALTGRFHLHLADEHTTFITNLGGDAQMIHTKLWVSTTLTQDEAKELLEAVPARFAPDLVESIDGVMAKQLGRSTWALRKDQ